MSNIAKIEKETAEQARKAIIANIVILPELQRYIPPLDGDTLQQLEQNILAEGVRDSIILWQTTYDNVKAYPQKINNFYRENCYVVVDGHNRYGICQKHNIDFPFIVMDFESIEAVKAFMVKLQLGRRNLTKEQISYFRGLEYTAAKKQHGGVREEKASSQNEYLLENKKTVEVLAAKHNTSAATIQRDEAFAKGLDLLTEDFRNEVLSGKTKVDKQTIYNLPKVYAKFPEEFKIYNEGNLHTVYRKYRESEAKASPIPSPLPPTALRLPKGEKTATSGISKFQNLPNREEALPVAQYRMNDSPYEMSEEIKALKEKLNFLTAKLEQQKDYDDLKIQVGYWKEQQSIAFDQKVKFMKKCEELERNAALVEIKFYASEDDISDVWIDIRKLPEEKRGTDFTDYVTTGQASVIMHELCVNVDKWQNAHIESQTKLNLFKGNSAPSQYYMIHKRHSYSTNNKLQEAICEYFSKELVNYQLVTDLDAYAKQIEDKVNELNAAHKRCTPEKFSFNENNIYGVTDFGTTISLGEKCSLTVYKCKM